MFVEYFARKTCLFHFLLMFHAAHAVTPRYELPGRPFHPITVFRSNQEKMKGKRANPSVRPYSQGTPLELVLDTVCSSPCTVWGCFVEDEHACWTAWAVHVSEMWFTDWIFLDPSRVFETRSCRKTNFWGITLGIRTIWEIHWSSFSRNIHIIG